jgi:hypothetical protein
MNHTLSQATSKVEIGEKEGELIDLQKNIEKQVARLANVISDVYNKVNAISRMPEKEEAAYPCPPKESFVTAVTGDIINLSYQNDRLEDISRHLSGLLN